MGIPCNGILGSTQANGAQEGTSAAHLGTENPVGFLTGNGSKGPFLLVFSLLVEKNFTLLFKFCFILFCFKSCRPVSSMKSPRLLIKPL